MCRPAGDGASGRAQREGRAARSGAAASAIWGAGFAALGKTQAPRHCGQSAAAAALAAEEAAASGARAAASLREQGAPNQTARDCSGHPEGARARAASRGQVAPRGFERASFGPGGKEGCEGAVAAASGAQAGAPGLFGARRVWGPRV